MQDAQPREIRTEPRPDCYLCGQPGRELHKELEDRLVGVPGRWALRVCPAADCGLIWLDPFPVAADIGLAYEGRYYTHETATAPVSWFRRAYDAVKQGSLRVRMGYTRGVGPSWYRLLAPIAHLVPGATTAVDASAMFQRAPGAAGAARVLDVGCGSGELLARMRDLGWSVEGVDFDPRAVEAARSRGLTVRRGDLHTHHYPDATFDVVHLRHVIEHVFDPVGVLAECRRILKPGGRLVLITPNSSSWGHAHFDRDWYALDPPRHLHLFHVSNLRTAARRAGFVKVVTRAMCHEARTVLALSAMYRTYGLPWNRIEHRYNLSWSIRGVLYQAWEHLLSFRRPESGEEALCLAWKDQAA